MSFAFRLEDYARYAERVGAATYVDATRRTDPARIEQVWANLGAVVEAFGAPWVVQLWTKDARGVVARGGSLLERLRRDGTTLTAQVTVTGLGGTPWEPLVPAVPFAGLDELIALTGGPDHVKWRYDPILPSVHELDRFRRLGERAAGFGIRRCVANFVVPPGRYRRVDGRLSGMLPGWGEGMPGYDEAWRVEAAGQLVEAAAELGMRVAVCAESARLSLWVPGLQAAACGDHAWFVDLSGRDPGRVPTAGSRPGCGCAAYFDVGLYGQWSRCHRCAYCYAG